MRRVRSLSTGRLRAFETARALGACCEPSLVGRLRFCFQKTLVRTRVIFDHSQQLNQPVHIPPAIRRKSAGSTRLRKIATARSRLHCSAAPQSHLLGREITPPATRPLSPPEGQQQPSTCPTRFQNRTTISGLHSQRETLTPLHQPNAQGPSECPKLARRAQRSSNEKPATAISDRKRGIHQKRKVDRGRALRGRSHGQIRCPRLCQSIGLKPCLRPPAERRTGNGSSSTIGRARPRKKHERERTAGEPQVPPLIILAASSRRLPQSLRHRVFAHRREAVCINADLVMKSQHPMRSIVSEAFDQTHH